MHAEASSKQQSSTSEVSTGANVKLFDCEVQGCFYKGTSMGHVRRHMLTHTGERPFSCEVDECQYTASQNIQLKTHMKSHEKKLDDPSLESCPIRCKIQGCLFTAISKNHVANHMITHTGKRPFSCEVSGCGFSSSQRSLIKSHILSQHLDEKPVGEITALDILRAPQIPPTVPLHPATKSAPQAASEATEPSSATLWESI